MATNPLLAKVKQAQKTIAEKKASATQTVTPSKSVSSPPKASTSSSSSPIVSSGDKGFDAAVAEVKKSSESYTPVYVPPSPPAPVMGPPSPPGYTGGTTSTPSAPPPSAPSPTPPPSSITPPPVTTSVSSGNKIFDQAVANVQKAAEPVTPIYTPPKPEPIVIIPPPSQPSSLPSLKIVETNIDRGTIVQTLQPGVSSKTTIKDIVPPTPQSGLFTPEQKLIYETSKKAPTPMTTAGKNEWAAQQLIIKGVLPEGTGGYYTPAGKEKAITKYMASTEFQKYITSPQGLTQLQAIQQSNAEKLLTQPMTLIPGFKVNLFGKELGWGEVKQPQWMANLNLSAVTVYNPEKAKRDLATNMLWSSKDIYSTLAPRTRMSRSFGEAGLRAVTWPITLPQMGIKYLTGKTWLLPDVSQKLQERSIAPTQGYIEGTIGEALTWGKSDFSENIKKYPIETGFAGMAEIMGLVTGSKGVQAVKATTYRGLGYARQGIQKATGASIPGYEQISYYFPQRIIRRAWVKIGTKNINDVMGIPYHAEETLTPGGLSFAPGKTASQRITWTVGKAKESQALPYSEGDIMLGSSGANRVGLRYVIKPEVTHELPSLSTTPYGYAPTRFYRFNAPDVSYSGSVSLLPKMYAPTGLVTRIKNLYEAPKGNYEEIAEWSKMQPKGKWGVIGPKMAMGGPETEINIFGKTTLKRYLPEGFTPLKVEDVALDKFTLGYDTSMKFPESISNIGGKLPKIGYDTSKMYSESMQGISSKIPNAGYGTSMTVPDFMQNVEQGIKRTGYGTSMTWPDIAQNISNKLSSLNNKLSTFNYSIKSKMQLPNLRLGYDTSMIYPEYIQNVGKGIERVGYDTSMTYPGSIVKGIEKGIQTGGKIKTSALSYDISESLPNIFLMDYTATKNVGGLLKYAPQTIRGYQYYTDVPLESGKVEVAPTVFTKIKQTGEPSGIRLILDSKAMSKANEFISPFSSKGIPYTPIVSGGYILSKSLSGDLGIGTQNFPSIPSYKSNLSITSIPNYPSNPSYQSNLSISSKPSIPSVPSVPSVSSYISEPNYPSSPSISSILSIPSYISESSYPSSESYPSSISLPSIPSIPSIPSYPSSPSIPSMPSIPSYISEPSYPSFPSYPSYPSKPSYPSYPSLPSYPSKPSYPSSPSIPSIPSIPSYPSYPSKPSIPSIPTIPSYPFNPYYSGASSYYKMLKGFNVYIKERSYFKGKKKKPVAWFKANVSPLSREQALSLGGSAVEHSAAASFKIVPTSTAATGKIGFNADSWDDLASKFYEKNGTLIERTAHRINTSGEVKGISALGWIAQRQKAYQPPAKLRYTPVSNAKPIKNIKPVNVNLNIKRLLKGWKI